MSFPQNVKEDALVACGRHCCLCHKFCGIKIEVHHIKQHADGGTDEFENAIPLCFDCHADMLSYDTKHPKGNRYSSSELKRHRDNWYSKIEGNIGLADKTSLVETDKKIFEKLIAILPWRGSIDFIGRNNLAGFSFSIDRLDDLFDFEYVCRNPAFEFVDPDLEGMRSNLLENIKKFNYLIVSETFPCRGGVRYNEVPSELEETNPEHFHSVVTEIHNTASNIFNIYSELLRHATRKLGVLPDGALDC